MDEKTEELRDIFLDATGEETVTERQAEGRGSLADTDDEAATERIRDLVTTMRERYDFDTDLATETYVRLVRGFYDDADDETLAETLDVDPETVARARFDLHLVREADRNHPAFGAIREGVVAGTDDDAIATDLDLDVDAVARVRRVIEADREATRANERFRDAFAERLTDADLTDRLASDSREDGLEEATEDIETDVSF